VKPLLSLGAVLAGLRELFGEFAHPGDALLPVADTRVELFLDEAVNDPGKVEMRTAVTAPSPLRTLSPWLALPLLIPSLSITVSMWTGSMDMKTSP